MEKLILNDADELKSVNKAKSKEIQAVFEPMVEMLKEFEGRYSEFENLEEENITPEIAKKAKQLRVEISKVRIKTEKTRKDQKEEFLRAGKAIDGVANILKWAVSEKENKLKEIETFEERKQAEIKRLLQIERQEKLLPFDDLAQERNLSEMKEDEFKALLEIKQKQYQEKQDAIKKAEEERIKKEKINKLNDERLKLLMPFYHFIENKTENFGLLSESEFKTVYDFCKTEKEKSDAEFKRIQEQNQKLEKEKKEREEKERIEREKARKEQEELQKKLEKEREEKEKLKKAEEERLAKEAEEKQRQLSKNDEAKVQDLINELGAIKSHYEFKSEKNKKMFGQVKLLIDKIICHVEKD